MITSTREVTFGYINNESIQFRAIER
jgi:hypothetical protein